MSRCTERPRRLAEQFGRKAELGAFLYAVCLLALPSLSFGRANAAAVEINDRTNCPVECACLGNLVACTELQLIEAPSGLPPWTEILELNGNNIANLEFDSLLHLTKLRKLDLSANKLGDNFTIALSDVAQLRELKVNKNYLTQVPDLVFAKYITHLTLSRNLITSINGTALLSLQYLQYLDLSGNKISVLQRGFFLTPNRLMHLNLNANHIRFIGNRSFDNLTSLEELRLNKNNLTQLRDAQFTKLEKLRILEANRNNLQRIAGLSLKSLKNLQELQLKRNKINSLDDGAFWPLKNLIVLQLDFNMLTAIKHGSIFGLNHLQKLTLSHNRISEIDPQAWNVCKNIKDIDLSHNELVSINRTSFEPLTRLEKLKLNHNQITYISEGAFNLTSNLRTLELNFNKASYIVEDIGGIFSSLNQLLKLNLAYNGIKSINQNAFVGLTRIIELDLTGNNVTSIQENAFLPLSSLNKLKMNSRALVCDCTLQWLSVWLQERRGNNEVELHCGYPHWLQGMSLIQLHHANFTCDEYPKPQIIEEPRNQMGIKGDNVTLVCRATSTADAPLQFTWKHDNVEVDNLYLQTNISSSESDMTEASSVLHIVNVTHIHAGKYQCMVTNNYGTTYSAKAKLSVLVFPTFSKIPHDIRVTAGNTARLECSAEGQPSPQISWQKDGGNDFPAARERRMHMMPTDDVLFIVDVKMADTGIYSCTAQNIAGVIVANASLTIFETPSFVKPMENKEIMVGDSIVLECMASGSPRPKLSWRKDDCALQATERHFFTAEDQLLIIVNTIASDAGKYECQINNSLGSVVGASYLTIKPAPTSIELNESDILGLIIITVVCCAVATSVIWVVVIYKTRRLNSAQDADAQPTTNTILDAQTQLYLDTSSQHSKDSGTGDSTNPSNDQLQLYLPEETADIRTINNEEEMGTINVDDPLLRYTNHERYASKIVDSAV